MKPVMPPFVLFIATMVCAACPSAQADSASPEQAAVEPEQQAEPGQQAETEQSDSPKAAAARAAAIRSFTTQLSGASLVGQFTIDDAPADRAMKPDRYQLAKVDHAGGDTFLFVYSHKGVPIPLTLKVLWAGNTPVITLDDFTIIGMGTFSARVMFHGDRYAGTWQHGKTGGLMFGKIEKPAKPGTARPQPPAEKKKAENSDE